MVSVGCGVAVSAPAFAAAAISPASLVAHPNELTGFATAKVNLRSATSASRYAKVVLGESPREARKEVAKLKRKGFQEGVQELLTSPQGEALSTGLVLGSARFAKQELRASLSESLKAQGKVPIKRFTIAAIPGSSGFTAAQAGHPGGAANVLFSSGRCVFLVGNYLRKSPEAQLGIAPIAGATALYQRVKSLCV